MIKTKFYLYVLVKQEKPVYIGVTTNISQRKQKHKLDKDFDYLKILKVYDNKKDAYIAENAIIHFGLTYLDGLYNKQMPLIEYSKLYKRGLI